MISMRRATSVLLLTLAAPAMAQNTTQTQDSEKCRAEAEETQEPAARADGTQEPAARADGESLSARLDDCNGVLQPPPTGDAQIVEPAPKQGETPVIQPGEIPPQQ